MGWQLGRQNIYLGWHCHPVPPLKTAHANIISHAMPVKTHSVTGHLQ